MSSTVNDTLSRGEYDCAVYGLALKSYFEQHQNQFAIRRVMMQHKFDIDKSEALNSDEMNKKLTDLKCVKQTLTDKSYYNYFKYLTWSLRKISDNNRENPGVASVSSKDMMQVFYPYVEMSDKTKQILPSHSFLGYFLNNYESLFGVNLCSIQSKQDINPAANNVSDSTNSGQEEPQQQQQQHAEEEQEVESQDEEQKTTTKKVKNNWKFKNLFKKTKQ
jgi:hypothetical protein